jgi:arylsulfatase A-like enzyme
MYAAEATRGALMDRPVRVRRRWTFGAAWAVGTLLVGLGCSDRSGEKGSPGRPNVLLVTLDTTRADRLGCYGNGRGLSPTLDAFAADAVRFDRAIAQSAATPVSHASILTGLNPYQHGLRVIYAERGCHLSPDIPTLATILKDAGWSTGAFLSAFTVSKFYGFDRGFDVFDSGVRNPESEFYEKRTAGFVGWDTQNNQRRSDDTTDRVLEWLGKTRGPFFAWVHYWDPHDRVFVPPAEVVRLYTSPARPGDAMRRDLYDAEVRYMDSQIGRLLQRLREDGRYDNTVIVFVADHGQGLGDHDWWAHRLLYQEQIHVPLLVRTPGGARGRAVDALVRTIDILPTVLDVLGLDAPKPVEGRSFRSLMSGATDEPPRLAYADALNLYDLNAKMILKRPKDDLLYCAMDRRWKLIYRPNHAEDSELYDLGTDPAEANNLYAARRDQVARLLEQLNAWGGFATEGFGKVEDSETLRRLQSLGYMGGGEGSGAASSPATQP